MSVGNTSKIYHLQENSSGFYELYMGDGVIGTKPSNNNIVTLDYVYSHDKEANGASVFTMVDSIGGFSRNEIQLLGCAQNAIQKLIF